jgi:hypothetical protein
MAWDDRSPLISWVTMELDHGTAEPIEKGSANNQSLLE